MVDSSKNDKFIEENGPIGPECFGGSDYPDLQDEEELVLDDGKPKNQIG